MMNFIETVSALAVVIICVPFTTVSGWKSLHNHVESMAFEYSGLPAPATAARKSRNMLFGCSLVSGIVVAVVCFVMI